MALNDKELNQIIITGASKNFKRNEHHILHQRKHFVGKGSMDLAL